MLDRKRLARAVQAELSDKDDRPYSDEDAKRIADALIAAYLMDEPARLELVLDVRHSGKNVLTAEDLERMAETYKVGFR